MAAHTTEADRPRTTAREAPAARTGPTEDPHRHVRAVHHAIDANTTQVHLPLCGAHAHLELPPADKLAFYAGLAGAAAFGVIEWPIAIIAGVGHLLSDDRHNRMLRALGEALDAV